MSTSKGKHGRTNVLWRCSGVEACLGRELQADLVRYGKTSARAHWNEKGNTNLRTPACASGGGPSVEL